MSKQPEASKFTPEHRRHARMASSQRARLVMSDGASVEVVIRDFCPNGLHMAFLNGEGLGAMASLVVGGQVRVLLEGVTDTSLTVVGKITHLSSTHAGLYVAAMPSAVLEGLKAAASHPEKSLSSTPTRVEQDLLLECNRHFGLFQKDLIEDFIKSMAKELDNALGESSSISEQSAYKYSAQTFRQHATTLKDTFRRGLLNYVKDEGKTAVKSSVNDGISLVGQDEFEDWLNLSNVVSHIEAEFNSDLAGIELRYAAVVRHAVDNKSLPFGPAVIGKVFQGALACMDLSNDIRKQFYLVFGAALARHYPSLFKQLNAVLAHVDVSPKKVAASTRSPGVLGSGSTNNQSSMGGAGAADGTGHGVGAVAMPTDLEPGQTADHAGGEYSLDHLLGVLSRTWQSGGHGGGLPRPMGGSGPWAHDQSHPKTIQVAGGLQQIVQSLAHLRGGRAGDHPPVLAQPEGTDERFVAGVDQLLKVVDSMPTAGVRDEAPIEPLRQQVSTHLASVMGRSVQLEPQAQLVLNLMSDLLGKALSQYQASSDIEHLVRKLERPLLKLALKDESFLDEADHPARQVVNTLDQFSIAADDKGKIFDQGLRTFLHQLVDRICALPEQDPQFYASINSTLEKILQPIHQHRRLRVARLQESSEGRDRIRKARARISDYLSARLAGTEVPEIIVRMLDAGWQQYLVLLELRHGMNSAAFKDAEDLFDRLCAACSPDFKAREHFEVDARKLLRRVERALATVSVDVLEMDAFMADLQGSLISESRVCAMVMFPADRYEASSDQDEHAVKRNEALIERMRMGDWWDISMNGLWVPMQLIWTSQPLNHCAFANRSATNKLELSLDELAQRIQAEQARPADDQNRPLLERSEHAMVDEAYHRLRDQATHSAMTGLINRKGFMHRLNQLGSGPDAADRKHIVGIIEFDAFRMIFNQRGVEAGEVLAREMAEQVGSFLRPEDVLASFSDDTMAVLMVDADKQLGMDFSQRLIERMNKYRFTHGGGNYSVGVNIGLADFSAFAMDTVEVVRRADSACVASKSSGRNQVQVYEASVDTLHEHEELMEWAGIVDHLLETEGSLFLRFQMVMPIRSYSALKPYYEILLGVHGLGEEGNTAPQNFIIAVERLNRAHEVDLWVLGQVFGWIRSNRMLFDSIGGFSLNLSAWSLRSPEVLGFLHTELGKGDIPADRLIFEITETMAIDSYASAQNFIQEIRHYGCKFSIDDFGSGHASYAYLKDLRTDVMKIDGYFVKDLAESETDYAMVKSMNEIAHSLGMRTVAEYVETPEILERLREIGVDYAQGFLIHKPVPITQLGIN